MAPPLNDAEKERIIELCQAGHSRNDIAQIVNRSPDSITRIAQEIGHRFGQTNLTRAHEARSAFTAERRAKSAARAQEKLDEILELMGEAQEDTLSTKDGAEIVSRKANAKDWRDWASAVAALQKTVLDVDRADNRADEGLAAVDQWLRSITGSDT